MRVRLGAPFGALAVVALLVLLPAIATAGSDPIVGPNPNSAGAGYARAAAGANENGWATLYTFNSTFVPAKWCGTNTSKWCLYDYTLTLPTQSASGITLVSDSLYLNRTHGCATTNQCPGYYGLNGYKTSSWADIPVSLHFPSSVKTPYPAVYLNWTGCPSSCPSSEGQPVFEWSLLFWYTATQAQSWGVQGSIDTLFANVTFLGGSAFGGSAEGPNPADTAWWVPYPAGTWQAVSVTDVDTGVTIPADEYAFTSGAFLLEWADYPVSTGTQVAHFEFMLTAPTTGGGGSGGGGAGGGGGGAGGGNHTGNTTSGVNSTFPTTPAEIGEVVLTMGNVTPGPTFYQASTEWQNLYNYNFTGIYYLEASWVANAADVTLTANGAPVPSYEYLVSNTSIVLFAGYVVLAAQGTVAFVAHYTPTSAFHFLSALIVIDGDPVTIWQAIAWGGLAAVGGVAFLHVRDGPPKSGSTGGKVMAVILFSMALITLFSLRG